MKQSFLAANVERLGRQGVCLFYLRRERQAGQYVQKPLPPKSMKVGSGNEKEYSDRNIPQQCTFRMVGCGVVLFSFYSLALSFFFCDGCYLHNQK